MAAPDPAPSLTRNSLIPLSLVVCFALVYWLRAAPFWIAVVGVPIVLLYVGAPRLGRTSLARFDRDAIGLLASGRKAELRARYARAILMRLFAAPALAAERRGLVAAETGDAAGARSAYRAALDGYPQDRAPVAVRLGLAHAAFALGDDREAILHYQGVLTNDGRFPRVARNLAHALARRGEELDQAEELAEEALRESKDASAKLVRALVHAKRGEAGPARKLLKAARRAKGVDELREDVEVALEEI
jgi:tetratricopeptide (TPR) repeat protein